MEIQLVAIKEIITNPFLTSAVMSWFIAQFIKIIIEISKKSKLKTKDFVFRALFGTGGMPSSHSATVTAIAVGVGLKEGFGSALFAFSFIFVFIVIRDATGVRLSAGKQAQVINQILSSNPDSADKIPKIKEIKGHTPLECFVGVIIGLIVSLGIFST
ncbi:MAG TPA: hypothetical protein DDY71_06590 [Spirochaetia bacterium]|nr:hypothetical protein [Spirochaetia bacterium]HBI37297.1 hypothetical protein [Spirochaetia bacterium]